jgi:hypothetical protein
LYAARQSSKMPVFADASKAHTCGQSWRQRRPWMRRRNGLVLALSADGLASGPHSAAPRPTSELQRYPSFAGKTLAGRSPVAAAGPQPTISGPSASLQGIKRGVQRRD